MIKVVLTNEILKYITEIDKNTLNNEITETQYNALYGGFKDLFDNLNNFHLISLKEIFPLNIYFVKTYFLLIYK